MDSDLTCEVCGDDADPDADGSNDVIIEYTNLVPEYTETYAFCGEHRPGDIEAIKRRIKAGFDPIPSGEHKEEYPDGIEEGWPEDDIEVELRDDADPDRWRDSYPDTPDTE